MEGPITHKRNLNVHWRDQSGVADNSREIQTLIQVNINSNLSTVSSASFTMSDDSASSTGSFINEVIATNRPSHTKWLLFFYSYISVGILLLLLSVIIVVLPIFEIYGVEYKLRKSNLTCTQYDVNNCQQRLKSKFVGICCYLDTNTTLREGMIDRNDSNAQISMIFGLIIFLIAICILKPCFDILCKGGRFHTQNKQQSEVSDEEAG